ncbi:Hint domain-containing protein [Sulfitobacter sp. 1A12157]|uniref:Hint domain-containing protein n=1 Tax=Sulfitobacter sp. 1A12157 TaxID=3368594 RepID=UPI00374516A0
MKTGFRGTFVISWSQTEIDGLEAAPVQWLELGSAWAWRGDTIRVDGPNDVLRLDMADGAERLRKRAARKVQRLIGAALEEGGMMPPTSRRAVGTAPLPDDSFMVTNGARTYTVTLIDAGPGRMPLLMFVDELPPRDSELWVMHSTLTPARADQPERGGVICFTPGTRIRTPKGSALIEELREGDLIQTKDNGAQPLTWIGSRRMSGARLHAMPHLRPVRFRPGALGIARPDAPLLVSPDHRIVLQGAQARDLFNSDEVLVAAKDLINGRSVASDTSLREVTYIHVLLAAHQVMWANGVETESFHPASAPLTSLGAQDRARLLAAHPQLETDPHSYGGFARRNLSTSEAAILQHVA